MRFTPVVALAVLSLLPIAAQVPPSLRRATGRANIADIVEILPDPAVEPERRPPRPPSLRDIRDPVLRRSVLDSYVQQLVDRYFDDPENADVEELIVVIRQVEAAERNYRGPLAVQPEIPRHSQAIVGNMIGAGIAAVATPNVAGGGPTDVARAMQAAQEWQACPLCAPPRSQTPLGVNLFGAPLAPNLIAWPQYGSFNVQQIPGGSVMIVPLEAGGRPEIITTIPGPNGYTIIRHP